ncbi:HD domain-containing protein [bacterium]|nr:HD domain-containing protein [bacterium]
MDIARTEAFVVEALGRWCKPSRAEHSRSVAAMAAGLCERFGLDSELGRLAGLAHDIAKDRPLSEQWEEARAAAAMPGLGAVALAVSRIEAEPAFADKIIHGPAAAAILGREFGRREFGRHAIGRREFDPFEADILEAVAYHSSAAIEMRPLAKIVFIADKIEPRRPYLTDADRAAAAALGLDDLLIHALWLSISWLRRNGRAIAQSTLDLYNALTVRDAAK